jgi:O-antigen/teichoic acid export membrane protein
VSHATSDTLDLTRRIRSAGRGTAATLLARGADVAMRYAFYAVMARSLSVVDFGQLILGFTILQAAATTSRVGLDQALLAVVPGGSVNRFCVQVVILASGVIAIVTTAALLFAWRDFPPFGLCLAAGLPAVALGQLIIGALRARGDVSLAATAESVVQPGGAWIFAIAAAGLSPSPVSFALAFVMSWALTLAFAVRLEWRGPRLEWSAASRLLHTGRSMLGVVLLQTAAMSADILILGAIAATSEVGRYAVVQKIAAAFVLLQSAVSTSATPFMRSLAGDRRLLADYYRIVTRWMVTVSIPLLIVTLGNPTLVLSLFGHDYLSATTPLVLLSLAAAVLVFSGPAGSILLCTGHARQLLRITTAGTAALIISVALLARYGAVGAALGVLAGRVVARGLLMIASRRIIGSRLDASLLLILGGASAGVLATRLAVPWLGEIPATAVGCAIALAVAFIVLIRTGDVAVLVSEFRRS